jgi:YtkA-like
MKRIAAPMIGGVITNAILELLIYPVIFVIWRRRSLSGIPRDIQLEAIANAPAPATSRSPRSSTRFLLIALAIAALAAAGYYGWRMFDGKLAERSEAPETALVTRTVGGLTVTLLHPDGQLRATANEAFMEFRNTGGELVDVGEVKLNFGMNMTGMVMHSGAAVKRTDTPGRYRVEVTPDMGGEWIASLSFDGPQGNGETSFSVNVRP